MRLLRLVGPLGSIFGSSRARFKNDFEKTSKKVQKSRILASQTPPKTLPKSYQNRGPKKHAIFERIFDNIFQNSKPRNLENINFPWGKPLFLRFSLKTCFCNFHAFSVQKTYQKPFQNEVRTMKKSMSKTCCFLTSIFWGSGLDFGASWASNLEPCWQFWLLDLKGLAFQEPS